MLTSLSDSKSLYLNDGSSSAVAKLFRQVVGALQYLSLTHPYVCFVINKISQFMHIGVR